MAKPPHKTNMNNLTEAVNVVKTGGLVVIPTDTVAGLVGKAGRPATVERIYKIKNRDPKKPLIILISSISDLDAFNIEPTGEQRKFLENCWPGAVSIILNCPGDKYNYLHRGTNTLAFRLPKPKWLLDFIKQTGPVVAPSANPEGQPPAKNTAEAKEYFGRLISFYADFQNSQDILPSTVVSLTDGIKIARPGSVEIDI